MSHSKLWMEEWKKVRAKGASHFIFRHGWLGFGLPCGVVCVGMQYFGLLGGFSLNGVITQILCWSCGGLFRGLLEWHEGERRYTAEELRQTRQREQTEPT